MVVVLVAGTSTAPSGEAQTSAHASGCRQAVFEGDVAAGQGFEKVFSRELKFYLEPLHSGWIVRVLPVNAPRVAHDAAELATPPYQSVSPLLISTDWSFRAQDAISWNPRHFRYAGTRTDFEKLSALQPGALAGDPASEAKIAELVIQQPEATLEIQDARFAPGRADQAKMASAVALHLPSTPHEADTSAPSSPLGKLETLRFRVTLELPPGIRAAPGVREVPVPCVIRPTTGVAPASQHSRTPGKR